MTRHVALEGSSSGNILFSFQAFRDNPDFGTGLRAGIYATPALTPDYPWLANTPIPTSPRATVSRGSGAIDVSPILPDARTFSEILVSLKRSDGWETRILPTSVRVVDFGGTTDGQVVIAGMDRYGRLTPWRTVGTDVVLP